MASHAPRLKPSLRTEFLLNLAALAAGALLLAVVSAALAPLLGSGALGFLLLVALIAADLVIFVAFGRYLVSRLVTRPMDALVDATEAVAAGELSRRAPAADTRELDRAGAERESDDGAAAGCPERAGASRQAGLGRAPGGRRGARGRQSPGRD